MWKNFFRWLLRNKQEPAQGSTIYETLLNQMGDLDEINDKKFDIAKARLIKLTVASDNLGELSELLLDAAGVVGDLGYFGNHWKSPAIYRTETLEDYISDGESLIHPLDWIKYHHHYIIKLLDAFMKMDDADGEYYQRKCNFVVEDILSLLSASRGCIR